MAGACASNPGIKRITPSSSRDFQKAALQRLTTAEFLFKNDYNLDPKYLAGYAIECALKALLLEITPQKDRAQRLKSISSGAKMHRPEILGGLLKDLGRPIPSNLVKKFRRFAWSTDLRYQTGRTKSAETGGFLKAAKETCEWVEGQLASARRPLIPGRSRPPRPRRWRKSSARCFPILMPTVTTPHPFECALSINVLKAKRLSSEMRWSSPYWRSCLRRRRRTSLICSR